MDPAETHTHIPYTKYTHDRYSHTTDKYMHTQEEAQAPQNKAAREVEAWRLAKMRHPHPPVTLSSLDHLTFLGVGGRGVTTLGDKTKFHGPSLVCTKAL